MILSFEHIPRQDKYLNDWSPNDDIIMKCDPYPEKKYQHIDADIWEW